MSPALTTVTVPLARLGRAAVDLLVEVGQVPTATESALALALGTADAGRDPGAGTPPSVLIGVELVVRASTGVASTQTSEVGG